MSFKFCDFVKVHGVGVRGCVWVCMKDVYTCVGV